MVFSHPIQNRILPRWCPPPPGALKLNFDYSACGNPSPTGLGGVIRDSEGTTILSYSGPACFVTNNNAELMALRTGIREALKLKPQWLLVEGDSYCVIQWASQSSNPSWILADIIQEVVQLSRELNIAFHHIKDRLIRRRISSSKRECLKLL